jgi:hypothetical protein
MKSTQAWSLSWMVFRRKRRRSAESEQETLASTCGMVLSTAIIISACVLLLLGGGAPTPVDATLRIHRDAFDGTTNFAYLSTRYNFEAQFRTDPETLIVMADALLPNIDRQSRSRDKYNNVEGLAIVIRRLAFPSRWPDLTGVFGRPPATLCRIFHEVLQELDENFGHLLDFNPQHFAGQLQNWAAAIADAGSPAILNIVAFLDGTLRRTTRPGPASSSLPPGVTPYALQRAQYSGHKRHHGFKFQDVVAPNGLLIACFGPVDGRRSDSFMLAESGLVTQLPLMVDVTGVTYRLFGDSIYPFLPQLFRMYRNTVPGSPQYYLNRIMSSVRVSVEWGFNLVTNTFQAVDFIRWQRFFLTKPARQYRVASLLTNCLSCVRGTNQISVFFLCPLPSLDEYLQGDW